MPSLGLSSDGTAARNGSLADSGVIALDPQPVTGLTSSIVRLVVSSLTPRQRRNGLLLLPIILGEAVLETVGIGLVFPLLALASGDPKYTEHAFALQTRTLFGLETNKELVLLGCAIVLSFGLVRGAYLVFANYIKTRYLQYLFLSAGQDMFRSYLGREYQFHTQNNAAHLISAVTSESNTLSKLTKLLITLVTDLVVSLFLLSALVAISIYAVGAGFLITVVPMSAIYLATRRPIRRLGMEAVDHRRQMLKWLTQGLHGIRDVKVAGVERFFEKGYAAYAAKMCGGVLRVEVLKSLPRTAGESLMAAIIAIGLGYVIMSDIGLLEVLPVATLFVVAGGRLVPIANRFITNIQAAGFLAGSMEVVHANLVANAAPAQPVEAATSARLALNNAITVEHVSVVHAGQHEPSVEAIDFTIRKGTIVGLVGPSGAGKTTILNVLLGLTSPTKGSVGVDGVDIAAAPRAWQRNIGCVPQDIFVLDDTIRRNVAFAIPDAQIDNNRVWEVLRLAHCDDFVRSLPRELDTIVGDRGALISGGQRQRIALARALYADPAVLILDEATSALDMQTQRMISDTLRELAPPRTIIIVTHQMEFVECCDEVHVLSSGKIVKSTRSRRDERWIDAASLAHAGGK